MVYYYMKKRVFKSRGTDVREWIVMNGFMLMIMIIQSDIY